MATSSSLLLRRLVLAFVAAGLVVAVSAVDPTRAYACECAGIGTQRAVADADAIFAGTVQSIEEVGRRDDRRADIRFSVTRVFKGTVYASQLVASPTEAESCGLTPKVGSTWVIFATDAIEGSGDSAVRRLRTTVCSGNLPTAQPPTVLGRGTAPLPGESDREERAESADNRLTRGLVVAGIGVLGLLALVGAGLAYLWRPGRQST